MSQPDSSINPTPVVGMLGLMDSVTRVVPAGFVGQGQPIVLFGAKTAAELDGSAWARFHGHFGGRPPVVDFAAEQALGEVLISGAKRASHLGAHDLSNGGLAQALVDMACRFETGARLDLRQLEAETGLGATALLFSETQARAVACVREDQIDAVCHWAEAAGVGVWQIGESGGSDLSITLSQGEVRFSVRELADASAQVLPTLFE